jgi:hypothetical protein
VDGSDLTLGVSGMLLRNALVMYDRETETFWSHFTGEGLAGPLKGKTLELVTSAPRVRWSEWVARHPDTRVLQIDGVSHVERSRYEPYFADPNRAGVHELQTKDSRLPAKSLVLGLLVGGSPRAYPVSAVPETGVVTDVIGGRRIVIVTEESLGFYGAFEMPEKLEARRLEGHHLLTKDGRRFNVLPGGGNAKATLEPLPVIRSFWFAWAEHHPDTTVWKP